MNKKQRGVPPNCGDHAFVACGRITVSAERVAKSDDEQCAIHRFAW